MKLFRPPAARPRPRDVNQEAQAAMAGFVRVLERLLPGQDTKLDPGHPAWPARTLQEKP